MQKSKVLALDYGTKHIGIATGDENVGIAFPREVFDNKADVLDKIFSLCEDLAVGKIIVGFPLSMNDEHKRNEIMIGVEKFADDLKKKVLELDIKVEFFDERLSSFEAEELTGKKARTVGERLDAYAAQIILQRYFDKD